MIRATQLLFIDANVPIYAAGPAHRLKEPSGRVLDLVAGRPSSFVTSAEVLQEVLHYSLRRGEPGRRLFSSFTTLMARRVEAVFGTDVEVAADITAGHAGLEARDGVHAAVMRRLGIRHVVSADPRLSRIQGLERLDPGDVVTWSANLFSSR